MIHQMCNTPIYFSKKYSDFSFLTGNRVINEMKIKNIIKDIDAGLNMLRYCPIVVTKDLKIIDGQHRYYVSKTLKQPVFFVIAEELSLHDVAKINSRTERWKPMDFVRCYMETGNENYKILYDFIEKYEMPVTSAWTILMNGIHLNISRRHQVDQFERGEFIIHSTDEAHEIMSRAIIFKDCPFVTTTSFLQAITVIIKKGVCDWELMEQKHLANPTGLKQQPTHKQYLVNLEEVYNFKNSIRKTIY